MIRLNTAIRSFIRFSISIEKEHTHRKKEKDVTISTFAVSAVERKYRQKTYLKLVR